MKPFSHSIRVNYDGSAVTQGTRRNAQDVGRLNDAAQRGNAVAQRTVSQNRLLATSYSRVALAVSAALASYGTTGFVSAVSNSELLTIRLKNLTGSAEQYAEVQGYLADSADRLNIRYNILADSYTRLLVLERQQTVTATESRQILEGLTDAAKTMGASNEQVERSMYGMVQALTQGTVQTTELLQTTESMPGLLQAMDKAAGLSANGFKRLVGEGKVTSQFFKETLIKAFKEFGGAAEDMAGTISGSTNDFLTVYDQLLVKLQQPVNSAVVPLIEGATNALTLLGDNVEVLGNLADGAVILAAVLAGRLTASYVTSTAAMLAKQKAAWASVASEKTLAAQNLATAKTQLHYAQQTQAGAARQLAAARSDYARSAAVTNLAAQNTRLTASQVAVTNATNTYTAAAARASVASRTLGASMAFLGGPVGVAITAGIALAYFATRSDEAKMSSDDLRDSVDKLSAGFDNLTRTQLELRQTNIEDALASLDESVEVTKTKINELRDSQKLGVDVGMGIYVPLSKDKTKAVNKEILEQEAALEEHEREKKRLLDAQAEVKKRLAPGYKPEEAPKVANDPFAGIDYSDGLEKLEKSLQTRRERVQSSFTAQKNIVHAALADEHITELKAAELIEKLERKKQKDLTEISLDEQKKRDEAANAARKKELDDIEKQYEERIRLLLGFASRKEQVEYDLQQRVAQVRRDQDILTAQGFANERERDEHAHQERLLDIKFQGNSQMRDIVFSRAEWERKTELEKTESLIGIGEAGFKAFAGQSKKAAAAYKVFAIGKALINTYEMATSAYAWGASFGGPIAGFAAAGLATAFGLAQVNAIKNQDASAAYHGGIDYLPSDQTAKLQRGERIVSPRQNVQMMKAIDKINQGQGSGQVILNMSYAPNFEVAGTDDSSLSKLEALEQQMQKRFFNNLAAQLNGRSGVVYQSVRKAAS